MRKGGGEQRARSADPELDREAGAAAVPLCIDVDGTLLRTDTLIEAILELIRRHPGHILRIPLWLRRGKAAFKEEIRRRITIDAEALPVNPEVLHWLQREKATGRELLLCTGASAAYGEAVAARFGLFDRVLTSDGASNLTGGRKAARLVEEFGERGFDYAGNAVCDLPVWQRARAAIVVAPTLALAVQLKRVPRIEKIISGKTGRLRSWLLAARVHHWVKNALVFVPAAAAQAIGEPAVLTQSLVAFLAFSLAASGTYICNDLLDLRADRAHPLKRNRPFASGDLQATEGIAAGVTLVGASLAIGYFALGWLFLVVLCGYVVATAAYSLGIKRRPAVDLLWLAALYTGRILAGSAATGIEPSFWLLSFSMFLFLSLAAAKRSAELGGLESRSEQEAPGRGYAVSDAPLLLAFGVAAAYTSVLIFALYVFSRAEALYAHPEPLWLVCPALLYWTSRIWLKVHRRQLHEDPLVFAFTDAPSVFVGVACLGLVWVAV